MNKIMDVLLSAITVSLSLIVFIILIATGDDVCHKWIAPWMIGGDVAEIFTLCEGR